MIKTSKEKTKVKSEWWNMNSTSNDVFQSFDSNAWSTLLFCIFFFGYLISWLGFLSYKHYGSSKSAHIFELNVLLDYSLFFGSFVWEILWGVLSKKPGPWMCSLMMTPQHVTTICYYSAIAASHLETLVFLKVYSFHWNKQGGIGFKSMANHIFQIINNIYFIYLIYVI